MSSGIAVAVNNLEVVHVDGVAGHFEADGLEGAFAAADSDDIAIDEEADLLAAELLPVVVSAVATLREGSLRGEAGKGDGADQHRSVLEAHALSPVLVSATAARPINARAPAIRCLAAGARSDRAMRIALY